MTSLCGDFDKLFGRVKEEKIKSSDWNYSFVRNVVNMLLLSMYGQTTSTSKTKLINDICSNAGIATGGFEFLVEVEKSYETCDEENFLQIFEKWKRIYTVSDTQRQEILSWLDKTIAKRVETIMKGQQRGEYYQAALYIVALGEIYDTYGITTRQQFVQQYIEKYSRYSSFRKEIKELL